jgi:hypothetical protein
VNNLAVQDRSAELRFRSRHRGWRSFYKRFPVARQPALAGVDVGQRAKTVVLQLENPVGVVKGPVQRRQGHRLEARAGKTGENT